MDDPGPTISLRTKPAEFDKKRFELEWILPLKPGLSSHVTLFELECFPPHRRVMRRRSAITQVVPAISGP